MGRGPGSRLRAQARRRALSLFPSPQGLPRHHSWGLGLPGQRGPHPEHPRACPLGLLPPELGCLLCAHVFGPLRRVGCPSGVLGKLGSVGPPPRLAVGRAPCVALSSQPGAVPLSLILPFSCLPRIRAEFPRASARCPLITQTQPPGKSACGLPPWTGWVLLLLSSSGRSWGLCCSGDPHVVMEGFWSVLLLRGGGSGDPSCALFTSLGCVWACTRACLGVCGWVDVGACCPSLSGVSELHPVRAPRLQVLEGRTYLVL